MPKTAARRSSPAPGAIVGELPAAQAPQLCQLVTKAPDDADWLLEIKFDGYRLIASINRGRGRLFTRKGLSWADQLPHVAAAFARLEVTTAMHLDGWDLRLCALIDPTRLRKGSGGDHLQERLRAVTRRTRRGIVSIIGVYGEFVDKIPMGSAINRGLTFRMAQTPVQRYLPKLWLRAAGLTPHSLSPTPPRSNRARRCTRNFATRRMAASKL